MEVPPEYANLTGSDFVRLAREEWASFRKIIRRHPTDRWLDLVSNIENKGLDALSKDDNTVSSKVQPFQRAAIVDAAIRFSNNYRGEDWTSDRNALDEAMLAGHSYLGSDWLFHQYLHENPKYGTRLAIARSFFEQFNPKYLRPTTLIARANILFKKYDSRIQQTLGLSLTDILRATLAVFICRSTKNMTSFTRENLIADQFGLSAQVVDRFLAHYSADFRTYRDLPPGPIAPELEERYKFKALWRYPIIRDRNRLWAPVTNVLLKAVSEYMVYTILDTYDNPKDRGAFLEDCGHEFEKYTAALFESTGFSPRRCDEIPGIKGPRAEFYTEGEKHVVVECKRITPFRRDTLLSGSLADIFNDVEKMAKAYVQVDNSIKHLAPHQCHGLIVTFSGLPFSTNADWQTMISDLAGAPIDSPVPMVGLDDIELLTCLAPQDAIPALEAHALLPSHDKGYLSPYLTGRFKGRKWIHPLIDKSYDDLLKDAFPGVNFDDRE